MSRALPSATTLDHLKREARQWLKALRAGDADARARLQRTHPSAPADAGLRHVQHALSQIGEGLEAGKQGVQRSVRRSPQARNGEPACVSRHLAV